MAVFFFFCFILRFCRTWTNRCLITSQARVKRVRWIHHWTILKRVWPMMHLHPRCLDRPLVPSLLCVSWLDSNLMRCHLSSSFRERVHFRPHRLLKLHEWWKICVWLRTFSSPAFQTRQCHYLCSLRMVLSVGVMALLLGQWSPGPVTQETKAPWYKVWIVGVGYM